MNKFCCILLIWEFYHYIEKLGSRIYDHFRFMFLIFHEHQILLRQAKWCLPKAYEDFYGRLYTLHAVKQINEKLAKTTVASVESIYNASRHIYTVQRPLTERISLHFSARWASSRATFHTSRKKKREKRKRRRVPRERTIPSSRVNPSFQPSKSHFMELQWNKRTLATSNKFSEFTINLEEFVWTRIIVRGSTSKAESVFSRESA